MRSIQRVCDILDLLRLSGDGLSLTQIAEECGMPTSTVFRYLSTLELRHYVERDGTSGDYRLGLAVLAMREHGLALLKQLVTPKLTELRDRFGETINFGVLQGGRVRYVAIVESHHGVRLASREGDRDPIHSTALGKAIASQLPRDQLDEILWREGMPAKTLTTITDPSSFHQELAEGRTRGYLLDNGENEQDGRCVAVSVEGLPVPAGLSLSAPASRLSFESSVNVGSMPTALKEAARKIEEEFALRGGPPSDDLLISREGA